MKVSKKFFSQIVVFLPWNPIYNVMIVTVTLGLKDMT